MSLKKLFLKPMGVLCFLAFVACEDNNMTSDIENVEESLLGDVETLADGTVFPKESIEEIEAAIMNQMQNRKIMKRAANGNNTPHYVGVLAEEGSCGGMYIKWYMDCQDDEPMKLDKNATGLLHNDAGCYKPKGVTIDGNGNVTWYVCIVDANKYKFKSMKYGYAIFDLSHIQYLNDAGELFVLSDDEDNRNANRYMSPSYGFERNSGSNYLPKQELPMRNTKFWLYYFAPNPQSKDRLPNLGFEYEVFGNFDCCNNKNQNVLITDSEDHNNINYLELYRPKSGYPKKDNVLGKDYFYCPEEKSFNNNRVIKNNGHYLFFAIQSSKVYREK